MFKNLLQFYLMYTHLLYIYLTQREKYALVLKSKTQTRKMYADFKIRNTDLYAYLFNLY